MPGEGAGVARARFVRGLYECGRVPVAIGSLAPPAPEGVPSELAEALREIDALARADAPGVAPELDLAAAAWALERVLGSCRALVERSLSADEVGALLSVPLVGPRTAAVLWSADLTLRFLPDLCALARGVARDDPLVTALARLARDWPLSGVGVTVDGAEPGELPEALRTDACLRGLLVDRVLAHGSAGLEAVPWIAEALGAAVGAHPELAPHWNQPSATP
jgi:hypothetical protein